MRLFVLHDAHLDAWQLSKRGSELHSQQSGSGFFVGGGIAPLPCREKERREEKEQNEPEKKNNGEHTRGNKRYISQAATTLLLVRRESERVSDATYRNRECMSLYFHFYI